MTLYSDKKKLDYKNKLDMANFTKEVLEKEGGDIFLHDSINELCLALSTNRKIVENFIPNTVSFTDPQNMFLKAMNDIKNSDLYSISRSED